MDNSHLKFSSNDKYIDIRAEQMRDPKIELLRNLILNGKLPEFKQEAMKAQQRRKYFSVNEAGCLCRVDVPTSTEEPPIVLPESMIN